MGWSFFPQLRVSRCGGTGVTSMGMMWRRFCVVAGFPWSATINGGAGGVLDYWGLDPGGLHLFTFAL